MSNIKRGGFPTRPKAEHEILRRANCLFHEGNFAGAYDSLISNSARVSSDFRIQFLLGRAASELDRHATAIKAFRKASVIKSGEIKARRLLALELVKTGSFSEAEKILFRILEQEDARSRNFMDLGDLYQFWGEQDTNFLELALVCYREACECNDHRPGSSEDAYEALRAKMRVKHPRTKELSAIHHRLRQINISGVHLRGA